MALISSGATCPKLAPIARRCTLGFKIVLGYLQLRSMKRAKRVTVAFKGTDPPRGWLIAGLVLWGIVLWPFQSLWRVLSRRLPGARLRHNTKAVARLERTCRFIEALVQVLGADMPELAAQTARRTSRARRRLQDHVASGRWAEDGQDEDLWTFPLTQLEKAARVGAIDWRGDLDDLKRSLAPLLARQGANLDWSFVAALEKAGNWNALRNENLLPELARRLSEQGHVLVRINDGSDNYVLALCSGDEFARLDGVGDETAYIGKLA